MGGPKGTALWRSPLSGQGDVGTGFVPTCHWTLIPRRGPMSSQGFLFLMLLYLHVERLKGIDTQVKQHPSLPLVEYGFI